MTGLLFLLCGWFFLILAPHRRRACAGIDIGGETDSEFLGVAGKSGGGDEHADDGEDADEREGRVEAPQA
jgi:hypothetical protein